MLAEYFDLKSFSKNALKRSLTIFKISFNTFPSHHTPYYKSTQLELQSHLELWKWRKRIHSEGRQEKNLEAVDGLWLMLDSFNKELDGSLAGDYKISKQSTV